MWPGRRPATGWTPNRTFTPWARSRLVSSATACWALAVAMPYPGVMMTDLEFHSRSAAPAASISWCSPVTSAPPDGPVPSPKPPRMTETNERFMARHMM